MLHIFSIEYLKYRKTICVHHSAYMHVYYRKKATECNPALGGLIFFVLQ